jgi:hypothetical protein
MPRDRGVPEWKNWRSWNGGEISRQEPSSELGTNRRVEKSKGAKSARYAAGFLLRLAKM